MQFFWDTTHDHAAQPAVGTAHQRAVAAVDLVALVPRGINPRTARDGLIVRVIDNRPHLAGEFRGSHDADAGV